MCIYNLYTCVQRSLIYYFSGKKKVESSGYGRSSKRAHSMPPKVSDNNSDIQNPLLNYVNELTRSKTYSSFGASRFKRNVKKVQATGNVTKLFKEKGRQKHVRHWKLLLQH